MSPHCGAGINPVTTQVGLRVLWLALDYDGLTDGRAGFILSVSFVEAETF